MEFSPNNNVVKRCLQGMMMEDSGKADEAAALFLQAWNEATNDFEKFTASFYVARTQTNIPDRIQWLETAIQLAHQLNNDVVKAAFSLLYVRLAESYQEAGDIENARKNAALAAASVYTPADKGPFYHGTRADLQTGDFLVAGKVSNYQAELVMNHIYFTAGINGAALAAALAKGNGAERIYIVEPTGEFENDPNVTNKKFPGNPTRSYRTTCPLKIVGEVADWVKITPEELSKWRERLADNKGEIIN